MGWADLRRLEPESTGGYGAALSLAVALNPQVVARIPSGPHWDYSHEYDSVNERLDALGILAESWLAARGYDSYAVTRERAPYDRLTWRTTLPHKTVARLAGLGWIGSNALLVTPQYGCAQRLTTVLTRAPLPQEPPAVLEAACSTCRRCQEVCPGGAITGQRWREGAGRAEIVEAEKCQAALDQRQRLLKGASAACGLCLAICPHTRKFLKKAGYSLDRRLEEERTA